MPKSNPSTTPTLDQLREQLPDRLAQAKLEKELADRLTETKTFDELVNQSRLVRSESDLDPDEEAENTDFLKKFEAGKIDAVMMVMEHLGQLALMVNLTGRTLDELVAHCSVSSQAYMNDMDSVVGTLAGLDDEEGPGVETDDEE